MTVHPSFELVREQTLAEVNSHARLYRHKRTGAELLSLTNQDENKVFGITFRTPAADSTGLPHIMEHSVLCGSRKYPVKEPFIELAKGSLNTFLNAMTYPDKTVYPVASQNLQDFYNLVDVYLDAVFHPLITPYTLKQEGWHYELESPDGEMTFKGVVYNEMKGAYSTADDVLDQESQCRLYPDITYGVDSGGDPTRIPDLTYEQFKTFHEQYYHPSNSRIFFYGDDPEEQRLVLMDGYLNEYDAIPVTSQIALQPHFDQPRRVTLPYEASPEDTRSLISLAWMLPDGLSPEESIALSILSHILIGTPASPLRKALIDSGLGEDLTGHGFATDYRQPMFSVGMKGVAKENIPAVEQLILETLAGLARDGFDPLTVNASTNTLEFILRELNTGSYPRGLAVMLMGLETWLYDGDPLEGIAFEKPLQAVKAQAAAGKLYETLLHKHLVENAHRSVVILEPDPELGDRRAAAEKARLDQARAAMSAADIDLVVAETLELTRRQETPDSPEALATIPSLKLEDLDRAVRTIPSQAIPQPVGEVLYHDLFTNGILYLDLGFDMHDLPGEWLPLMPLFGRALTETGARDQDFVQLIQRIGSQTGGISPSTFISAAHGKTQAQAWFFLRGKAMLPQTGELLSILNDVLSSAHLYDRERFRQMALEEKAGLESALARMGHRMVNLRLRAQFSEAGWVSEQMNGVSQLFYLRKLLEEIDSDWLSVQARLEAIRDRLINRAASIANITVDAAAWQQVQPQLEAFLNGLPVHARAPQAWKTAPALPAEGLALPSQVNFVGKAANLYDLGYQLDGSMLAISSYVSATWLWEKVRVQGGAYGAMFVFDQYTGVLSYLSYRDPNLTESLEIYDQTAEFLQNLTLSDAELTKSIIGAIGDLDAYQLPDAKGYTALVRKLIGVDDAWRQQLRDQLLGATAADFHHLGEVLRGMSSAGRVAVLGPATSFQAVEKEQPGWMSVQQIL